MSDKEAVRFWKYLERKLKDLDDDNYTARLVYRRVQKLLKDENRVVVPSVWYPTTETSLNGASCTTTTNASW